MLAETSRSLSSLKTTFENLSDTPYIVHSSRIKKLLELARTSCEWCESIGRQSLIGHNRDLLLAFLSKLQEHLRDVENQVRLLYKEFLQALVNQTPSNIDDILDVKLPAIIDKTSTMHSGIQTHMVSQLSQTANLVLEMLRLITPKCSSELAKYQEQHADAKHRVDQNTEEIIRTVEQNRGRIGRSKLKYIDNENSLQQVAEAILGDLNDISSNLRTRVSQIQDSLGDRVLAASRMQEHINVLYYWFSAQLNDSYLLDKSLYFQFLNITEVTIVAPSPGDLRQQDKVKQSAAADVSLWSFLRFGFSLK